MHPDPRELLIDHGNSGLERFVGAAHSDRPAVEKNLATVVGNGAGDDLHQGALAGPVGAYEAVDLARAECEIDAVQDLDAGEGFGDPATGEEHFQTRQCAGSAR